MRVISSTEAKARLNAVLAEVEATGESVTVTKHNRPIAVISPATPVGRQFGQLSHMEIPDDFDAPLAEADRGAWEAPL